jgi:hypothetical protein
MKAQERRCSLDCFGEASSYCYGSTRKVTDIDIPVKRVDLENIKAVFRDVEGVDMVTGISTSASEGRSRKKACFR